MQKGMIVRPFRCVLSTSQHFRLIALVSALSFPNRHAHAIAANRSKQTK
jgi:hypothetical protein